MTSLNKVFLPIILSLIIVLLSSSFLSAQNNKILIITPSADEIHWNHQTHRILKAQNTEDSLIADEFLQLITKSLLYFTLLSQKDSFPEVEILSYPFSSSRLIKKKNPGLKAELKSMKMGKRMMERMKHNDQYTHLSLATSILDSLKQLPEINATHATKYLLINQFSVDKKIIFARKSFYRIDFELYDQSWNKQYASAVVMPRRLKNGMFTSVYWNFVLSTCDEAWNSIPEEYLR